MSDRERPCDCNKRAYYNRAEAEENAEHQMMENDAPDLVVYQCPDNEYIWHLARENPDSYY